MVFRITALIGALLVATSCSARDREAPDAAGVSGFWQMTADEDHGPLGEVLEFRTGGIFVAYDKDCNSLGEFDYHAYRGDIYVTNVIPGKGPVSSIFHPREDQRTLTFTSPRTR